MVLFGDLQDPPALIGQFTRKWEEGFDVVYGVIRRRTGDPFWKSKLAGWFYRTVKYLADSDVPMHATDFRLLSRRAIDAVNQFDERNRYIRGYSHWVGLRPCPIVYDRRKRTSGKSKASFFYLLNYAVNAITCFSIKPLRLFSHLWIGHPRLDRSVGRLLLSSIPLGTVGTGDADHLFAAVGKSGRDTAGFRHPRRICRRESIWKRSGGRCTSSNERSISFVQPRRQLEHRQRSR